MYKPDDSTEKKLRHFQQQFSKSISIPFDFRDGSVSTQPKLYSEKLVSNLVDFDSSLVGWQRLEIYNQQYWYRLLTVLQEELPLCKGVLGLYQFNQFATTYLNKFPSRNPSLNEILQDLPQFVIEGYPDQSDNLDKAISIDLAHHKLFFAPDSQSWNPTPSNTNQNQQATILTTPLSFQPNFYLYTEEFNFTELRELAKKNADDIRSQFISKKGFWALYRYQGKVAFEQLNHAEFELVELLISGDTFLNSLETWISKSEQMDTNELKGAQENIQNLFSRWRSLGWFVFKDQ